LISSSANLTFLANSSVPSLSIAVAIAIGQNAGTLINDRSADLTDEFFDMTDLYAPSGMNENRPCEWRKRHFLPGIDLDDNEAGRFGGR
jgi:hypothetical protein